MINEMKYWIDGLPSEGVDIIANKSGTIKYWIDGLPAEDQTIESGTSSISITKSLQYTIKKTPSAITKGLVYSVKSAPSAITKQLKYDIVGATVFTKRGFVYGTTSKSLPGNVAPGSSGYDSYVEDSGSFAIGIFDKQLTGLIKGQVYYVRAYAQSSAGYGYGNEVSFTAKNDVTIQKSLKYTVKISLSAITKGLVYKVKAITAITKSLRYDVVTATQVNIQKGLIYKVKSAPSAKTKSLEYCIKQTPSAITKSLKYSVKKSGLSITKGLIYKVKTVNSAITKGLVYDVKKSNSKTKSLIYKIKSPVTIGKTLKYCVEATPANITKGLVYKVKTPSAQTKSIQYKVNGSHILTKSLKYKLLIITQVVITKSLQYVVRIYPYKKQTLNPYTKKASPYKKLVP